MTQGRAPASASTAVAVACLRARLAGEPSPAGATDSPAGGGCSRRRSTGVSAELRGSAPRRTVAHAVDSPPSDPAATSGPRRIGSSSPAQNTRRAFAGPAARVGRFEHGRFDAVVVASWRGSHRAASASARCRVARRAAVGPTSRRCRVTSRSESVGSSVGRGLTGRVLTRRVVLANDPVARRR